MARLQPSLILLYFFGALALIQPLGWIFQNYSLIAFGHSINLSPVPVPFTNIKGYEVQNLSFTLSFENNNKIVKKKIDWHILNKIEGSDVRKLVYLFALSILPSLKDQAFANRILQFSFCPQGAISIGNENYGDSHEFSDFKKFTLIISDIKKNEQYELPFKCY